MKMKRDLVADLQDARSRPGGCDALRAFALRELASQDTEKVAYSLVVLCAVGLAEDLSLLEPLLKHPVDIVRRAARACRFELRRKK